MNKMQKKWNWHKDTVGDTFDMVSAFLTSTNLLDKFEDFMDQEASRDGYPHWDSGLETYRDYSDSEARADYEYDRRKDGE